MRNSQAIFSSHEVISSNQSREPISKEEIEIEKIEYDRMSFKEFEVVFGDELCSEATSLFNDSEVLL